jgi:hypothetical protein
MASRAQPGHRGDGDDRAAAARGHRVQDQLRGEHHRPQVQVQRVAPLRRVRRREARLLEAPGVAHQYTQPAVPPAGGIDRGTHPLRGRHVRADERPADPSRRRRTSLPVQIGDDYVHTLGRQPPGDPGADPGRTPGHQGRPPVKLHDPILRRRTDIPAGPGDRSAPAPRCHRTEQSWTRRGCGILSVVWPTVLIRARRRPRPLRIS